MINPFQEMYYNILGYLLWFREKTQIFAINLGFGLLDIIMAVLPGRTAEHLAERIEQWVDDAIVQYQ